MLKKQMKGSAQERRLREWRLYLRECGKGVLNGRRRNASGRQTLLPTLTLLSKPLQPTCYEKIATSFYDYHLIVPATAVGHRL